MNAELSNIPINLIDFDRDNPRIKASLEKYRDKLNEDRIRFAFRNSMDDSSLSASNFNSLKSFIRAAGGITVPITVYEKSTRYVCIDGNVRLLIYHEFAENNVSGHWKTIRAQVLNKPDETEINAVRVTAHLARAGRWSAYEKAQYLYELCSTHFLDYSQLLATCGGEGGQIEQEVQAYEDMNNYYRAPKSDNAFKMDRFDGFLELQQPGIKDVIYEAGFDLQDFGDWIRDGNIYRHEDVCKLPKVLSDKEATEKFITGGVRSIEAAAKIVDDKSSANGGPPLKEIRIGDASLGNLTEALLDQIDRLPRCDLMMLRNQKDETARETHVALAVLVKSVNSLLQDI